MDYDKDWYFQSLWYQEAWIHQKLNEEIIHKIVISDQNSFVNRFEDLKKEDFYYEQIFKHFRWNHKWLQTVRNPLEEECLAIGDYSFEVVETCR